MDYRKAYLEVYDLIIKEQEKKVIQYLLELKNQKRKWQSANSKVASILFQDLKDFEKIAPFHIHYQIPDFINNKNDYYDEEESLNLILQNEVQDLFDDGISLNLKTYEEFIEVLATYQGLEHAKRNYTKLRWLIELYYEYDEIDNLKLNYFNDVRDHVDYIRLTHKKFPDLKLNKLEGEYKNDDFGNIKLKKESSTKTLEEKEHQLEDEATENLVKEAEYERLIKKLTSEEKIFLLHYLINMPSKKRRDLDETEVIKVLYITDGTFNTGIFTKESKNLTFVNKYRNGLFYYKNPLKRKKLKDSILSKTIELKIDKFRILFEEDN